MQKQSKNRIEDYGSITEEEMAEAGLLAFFAIGEEWDLSTEQLRKLLGNPSRSRFFDLKAKVGKKANLSNDELDRLGYLTGIYSALNILYNEENTLLWLKNSSDPTSIWKGQSPLDYLLSGKMACMIDVYRYLNSMRGAA